MGRRGVRRGEGVTVTVVGRYEGLECVLKCFWMTSASYRVIHVACGMRGPCYSCQKCLFQSGILGAFVQTEAISGHVIYPVSAYCRSPS